MFETSEHFFEFLSCVFSGVVSGIFYEFFYLLKVIFNKNFINIILDVIYLTLASFICRFLFFHYNLSNFRLFYFIGVILGLVIYLNSFHNIIAFSINLVYNKINNFIKGLFFDVGTKKKKSSISGAVGLNNVSVCVHNDNSLSNDNDFCKEKSNRRIRPKNFLFKNSNSRNAR